MHKLEHIADRSTESLHATEMLLTPRTSNFAISLTLKTRAVTERDVQRHALTGTVNLQKQKSKFENAPCKTSICDQCVYEVIIHFNPLPDNKILDRSKLIQSGDDSFKFD